MTYRQRIGTLYEYQVLNHIRNMYDQVWHWLEFPEKLLYELNIIKDYDRFKKYRNDIGADLVAVKDNLIILFNVRIRPIPYTSIHWQDFTSCFMKII